MTLLPLGKSRNVATCPLSVAVEVSDFSAFVTEQRVTPGEWSKIIYSQILYAKFLLKPNKYEK